jgi:hypothetical protein
MGKEQFHGPKIVWLFKEEEEFTVPYEFLEHAFSLQAQKEKVIGEKERVQIKSFEINESDRLIHLNTEIYRMAEN